MRRGGRAGGRSPNQACPLKTRRPSRAAVARQGLRCRESAGCGGRKASLWGKAQSWGGQSRVAAGAGEGGLSTSWVRFQGQPLSRPAPPPLPGFVGPPREQRMGPGSGHRPRRPAGEKRPAGKPAAAPQREAMSPTSRGSSSSSRDAGNEGEDSRPAAWLISQ